MTPEQQRIAIAEFMGWHSIQPSGRLDGQLVGRHPDVPKSLLITNKGAEFPNYPEDLNELHKVWCSFTREQHQKFRMLLQEIVVRDGHVCGPCRSLSNATASQRTEAICGTIA